MDNFYCAAKIDEEQARKQFGNQKINQLLDIPVEPTERLLSGNHEGLKEYTSSISVLGGRLIAYYYQPEGADEWEFGEKNGVSYGNVEYIEFVKTIDAE